MSSYFLLQNRIRNCRSLTRRLRQACTLIFWKVALVSAITLATPATAEIYKIVDKDGNVVFTDVPPKDDPQSYTLKQSSSYKPPTPVAEEGEPTKQLGANFEQEEDPDKPAIRAYSTLAFSYPEEDQSIRENSGTVTFTLAIDPLLQGDHLIQVSVDGIIVQRAAATSVTVEHMDRGTHVLQASIVDADGTVLMSSQPRTFHLQRYSSRN